MTDRNRNRSLFDEKLCRRPQCQGLNEIHGGPLVKTGWSGQDRTFGLPAFRPQAELSLEPLGACLKSHSELS
jgi:hypothetical protein